jgi:UPF0716 protein FxsA
MISPLRAVFFLAFVAVPFLELALLIKAGQLIGFWPTVGLVLATGLAGATLLHRQGTAATRRIFSDLEQGGIPVESVADGGMIMLAGALLLAPGFLTDITGLLLLIPPVRKALRQFVFNRLVREEPVRERNQKPEPGRQRNGPVVIETEFERLDEETIDPRRNQRN